MWLFPLQNGIDAFHVNLQLLPTICENNKRSAGHKRFSMTDLNVYCHSISRYCVALMLV